MLHWLRKDHAEGMDLISELRQSLETYIGRPGARMKFHVAAKNFTRHELKHMRREERTPLRFALETALPSCRQN